MKATTTAPGSADLLHGIFSPDLMLRHRGLPEILVNSNQVIELVWLEGLKNRLKTGASAACFPAARAQAGLPKATGAADRYLKMSPAVSVLISKEANYSYRYMKVVLVRRRNSLPRTL